MMTDEQDSARVFLREGGVEGGLGGEVRAGRKTGSERWWYCSSASLRRPSMSLSEPETQDTVGDRWPCRLRSLCKRSCLRLGSMDSTPKRQQT